MKSFKITLSVLTIMILVVLATGHVLAEASFAYDAMKAGFAYEDEAVVLHNLGLFDGISTDAYDPGLGISVNRETGIALLVKMFGNKEAALAVSEEEADRVLSNYSDVQDITAWARQYMAYAVKTGMVQGDTLTTLSPKKPLDGKSYATMILRNLGYTVDAEGWRVALQTLVAKGGLRTEEAVKLNKPQLLRDDLVGISYGALSARSPTGETLIGLLIANGHVSPESARRAGVTDDGVLPIPQPEPTEEDRVYEIVKNALLQAEDQIDLSPYSISYSQDDLSKIVNRVINDTPEILYYDGYTYWSNGRLEFKYNRDSQTSLLHALQLKEQVDRVIKEVIVPGMTDYEKEQAIHDYIINHCRYDSENLEKNTIPPESYSAYGVLVLGTGVCEGYAEAMKLFMDNLGIECLIVRGESRGQGHAWNLIRLEGDFYHLDLTWDDPVTEDKSDILRYDYFNLTDAEIALDHAWNPEDYPPCTAVKYEYYRYNHLLIESYDAFYSAIKNALENNTKTLTFKIPDYKSGNYNVEATVNRAFQEVSLSGSIRYAYSVDDARGIVTIRFD